MSKTALIDALNSFDVRRVQSILETKPELASLQLDKGYNLLQVCCKRSTVGDRQAADPAVAAREVACGLRLRPPHHLHDRTW